MQKGTRNRWRLVAMIGVITMLAVPVAVSAAHDFTDVPDTNVFHEDISWLADAEITRGCNPPANTEFCPSDNVSREQMAAFMRRLAQYLGAEDGIVSEADHAAAADDADTLDGNDSTAFYTKAEVDAKIPTGVVVSGAVLRGDSVSDVIVPPGTLCWAGSGQNTTVWGNLTLPVGVTLSGMTVSWYDMSPADAQIKLWRISDVSPTGQGIATAVTSGAAGYGTSSVTFNETVETGEVFLVSYILPTVTEPVNEAGLCGLEIAYEGG